jgi:hypothetical protein
MVEVPPALLGPAPEDLLSLGASSLAAASTRAVPRLMACAVLTCAVSLGTGSPGSCFTACSNRSARLPTTPLSPWPGAATSPPLLNSCWRAVMPPAPLPSTGPRSATCGVALTGVTPAVEGVIPTAGGIMGGAAGRDTSGAGIDACSALPAQSLPPAAAY